MDGSGAIFSPCRRYRYRLWRVWDKNAPLWCFLMQNPSKADGLDGDMTVVKCLRFAERNAAGGIVVVNAFAWIETDTKRLIGAYLRGDHIVGADNREHLAAAFAASSRVIAAFGGQPIVWEAAICALGLVPAGIPVECFGQTKDGAPRHPSRLAYDTPLVPYAEHHQGGRR